LPGRPVWPGTRGKKKNSLICEGGTVELEFQWRWMVRWIAIQTLQGTQGVCANEIALPRLTPDAQKSSIYTIEFGSEYTVKIMQTIGKYLAIMYEGTACRFMNKTTRQCTPPCGPVRRKVVQRKTDDRWGKMLRLSQDWRVGGHRSASKFPRWNSRVCRERCAASKYQVDAEAGGREHPQVGSLLCLIRTCCGVWRKTAHARGDGAELPTSKHNHTV
jgi:hypothetical protein